MSSTNRQLSRGSLIAALLLTLTAMPAIQAHAVELVPAVGWTRATEGADDTEMFGSVALRAQLLPLLKAEGAVGYREESRFNDQLQIRTWPVTASLYFNPVPVLYAGAGVGWYNMSLDFDDNLGLESETEQEFGVHLGGGLDIPLSSRVGLDLNGRYVMLQEQDARLVPEKFDPDFWTTTVGLAFKFN